MWTCPVCETENPDGKNCRRCGFDQSTDYKNYPTLATAIPSVQSAPVNANVLRNGDPLRCAICRNDRFVVYANQGICVCTQCHNSMPLNVTSAQQLFAGNADSAPAPDEEAKASTSEMIRRIFAVLVLIAFLAGMIAFAIYPTSTPLYSRATIAYAPGSDANMSAMIKADDQNR